MKQLLKAVFIAVACLSVTKLVVAEEYIIPRDSMGQTPGDANLVGVDVIDSTGIAGVGLASPVLLYWVMVSSDVSTNYATLRDSATVNTSSNIKLVVFPNGDGGTAITAGSTMVRFNPPVIFRNGISIHLGSAPAGANARSRWQFGIRRRSIGNARGTDTSFSDTSD